MAGMGGPISRPFQRRALHLGAVVQSGGTAVTARRQQGGGADIGNTRRPPRMDRLLPADGPDARHRQRKEEHVCLFPRHHRLRCPGMHLPMGHGRHLGAYMAKDKRRA